jgi:hypothetical protein
MEQPTLAAVAAAVLVLSLVQDLLNHTLEQTADRVLLLFATLAHNAVQEVQ